MYAIFEDGSHQYRVQEGQVVRLDWREAPVGAWIEFQRVLMHSDGANVQIGRPTVAGVRVLGEVVRHSSIKMQVQHFRRRKNYRRLKGHRQHYLEVMVKGVLLAGVPTPQPPSRAAIEEPTSPASTDALVPAPMMEPTGPTPTDITPATAALTESPAPTSMESTAVALVATEPTAS